MGRVRFGISSWADRGLVASGFYPDDADGTTARLRHYSSIFSVAEIDSSYHIFLTRSNADSWLGSTPPGFAFDVKAFSLLTGHPTRFRSLPWQLRRRFSELARHKGNLYPHHLPAEAMDQLWESFADMLAPFRSAGKLGAVLFQFPPWFYPNEENIAYIGLCREKLPHCPLAVEFRARSWLNEEHRQATLRLLRELNESLVCVDEPQGFRSSVPPIAEATASLALVRFHGRNAINWERKGVPADEKFNYLYSTVELEEWLPRIARLAAETEELHVVFKNKHRDYPVRNAIELMKMFESARVASGSL